MKRKKENKLEGIFQNNDFIAPSYINITNPYYVEIDHVFYSGFFIVNYLREYQEIFLKSLIDNSFNMNLSIFYEKQDTYKTIRDLTYHIGDVAANLKEIKENSGDIDIANFTYQDAKYIRRELQVNNEEIYFLYLYINLFSDSVQELKNILNKVEGICQAIGLNTRRAHFRQKELFLSTLPLFENPEIIKNAAKRNVLTNGLLATYHFISSSIFDENGVLYRYKYL